MAEKQNRSDLLEQIQAGKVVYVNDRSAATEAELDFALQAKPTENTIKDLEYIDHSAQVVEVQIPALPETGENAIPASDPQVVAEMSPEGTSATALSVNGLPEGQKPAENADTSTGTSAPNLNAMTREELNAHAESVGVTDPHTLPNKQAVIEAVNAKG